MISCRLEKDANTVSLIHFSEGGATVRDYANATGYTIVNGATAVYNNTPLGAGVRLDTSPYITLGNRADLAFHSRNPFTFEFVFRIPAGINGGDLITKYNSGVIGTYKMGAFYNGTNPVLQCHREGGGPVCQGATAITHDIWHYGAFTYDGTTRKVYLDGAFDGSSTDTIGLPTNDSTAVMINGIFVSGTPTPGKMDFAIMRVSNIARSAKEIAYNFNRRPQIII